MSPLLGSGAVDPIERQLDKRYKRQRTDQGRTWDLRPLTTPLYTLVYITSGWHAAAGRWTNYDRQIADKCYYSSSLIEKEIRCGCAADFPCPSRPLLIDVTLLSPPASTSHSIPPFPHHPH